jgi:hypothetical protein
MAAIVASRYHRENWLEALRPKSRKAIRKPDDVSFAHVLPDSQPEGRGQAYDEGRTPSKKVTGEAMQAR